MSRNNYSEGRKCSGCGVVITNNALKCASCNTRAVGAIYRGTRGKRRKYRQMVRAELATLPATDAKPIEIVSVIITPRAKDGYKLRLHCKRCGGKRSDKSRTFCGPCYSRAYKPNYNEPDARPAQARMEFSSWQTLPDGTLMRTATGM